MSAFRRSFTVAKKIQILEEQTAEDLTNKEICRRYGLNLNQLKKWKTARPSWLLVSKRKRRIQPRRRSVYYEHEEALKTFILERRATKSIVSVRSLVDHLGLTAPQFLGKSFKVRQNWIYRFMKRSGFSLRRITKTVTISDEEANRRRVDFHSQIERRHFRNPRTVFLNMDQTSVNFGITGSVTVEVTGSKSVQIRSSEKQSDRVTVALTVASNGDKLHPFVIFKGTVSGRVHREFSRRENPYPSNMVYFTNKAAWMTTEMMEHWVNIVLIPYASIHGIQSVCLLLDSFQVHRHDTVVSLLATNGIELIFIPGGMTSDLQPLDVGINGPFKHYLQDETVHGVDFGNFSAGEKRFQLATSISTSWGKITRDSVINSFNRALLPTLMNVDEADEVE